MRKFLMMAFAITVFMALGAGSASAASGGGQGSGKPCPPASPVGQLNDLLGQDNGAPNCGNGGGGNNGGGNGGGHKCPPNSPNPGGTPPNCGNGGGGGGGGNPPPEPPADNCSLADLVLLTEDAKIVCLYLGENAENASTSKDCPDALIALPVSPVVGACVFLPPDGEGVPEVPGLPGLP